MKSIIDTLSPQTIETLISWCEDFGYDEVKKLAAKPISEGGLELRISRATLCRLYTTHGIADSKEARAEYVQTLQLAPGASLLDVAQDQLELRLLELASRPNPSLAELRLLYQITAKLRSLLLSQRRVEVAEKRETRQAAAQQDASQPPKRRLLTSAEIKHRTRVLLGKEAPNELDVQLEQEKREYEAWERKR